MTKCDTQAKINDYADYSGNYRGFFFPFNAKSYKYSSLASCKTDLSFNRFIDYLHHARLGEYVASNQCNQIN